VHQNAVLGAFLPAVGHQIVPENDLREASVSELEGTVMGMERELYSGRGELTDVEATGPKATDSHRGFDAPVEVLPNPQ
jgi:hypothetical protein